MADHADDGDGDIFVYRGGRAPQHINHACIDESVDEIEDKAFYYCKNLLTVETHDGIRKIGRYAFCACESLRRIISIQLLKSMNGHFLNVRIWSM